MELRTKAELIRTAAERWHKRFYVELGLSQGWRNEQKQRCYERLCVLPHDATEEQVGDIIGNPNWTHNQCDECDKDVEAVVVFGEPQDDCESATARICVKCLHAALDLAGCSDTAALGDDGRTPGVQDRLSALYSLEINWRLDTFFDNGYEAFLGDEINGFVEKRRFEVLNDAVNWLVDVAHKHYPSEFAAWTIQGVIWHRDNCGDYWTADLLRDGKKTGVTGNYYDVGEGGQRPAREDTIIPFAHSEDKPKRTSSTPLHPRPEPTSLRDPC